MKKIKDFIVTISRLRLFLIMESGRNRSLGFGKFVKSAWYGFFSISGILYDLKGNREYYLSDWARLRRASRIIGPRKIVLDDKFLFHKMNELNKRVVPIIGLTSNGVLKKYSNGILTGLTSEECLTELIQNTTNNAIIIKPQTGGGGAGITSVVLDGRHLVFSGQFTSFQDLLKKIGESSVDYIITEKIMQRGVFHKINPNSLNTLRVLTMIDPVSMEPFIAMAIQRFGVVKSGVVDNFTSGGISACVDVETGVIGQGATYPEGEHVVWLNYHPDTNEHFDGIEIPMWNEIKKYVIQLAKQYHYIPYVGWDIVPNEDSFYVLEGNSNSDVNVFQIHRPLLRDKRIRDFYRFHKVIN